MAKQLSPERRVFDLWFGLRVFTVFWACLCSVWRPLTPREKSMSLWPPGESWFGWVERVIFAPWERWDTDYFVAVLRTGYSTEDGSVAFHPLLPILSWPIALITGHPVIGLFLVSSVCSAVAAVALFRLARLDLKPDTAELACVLFLAFPVSAILFAPYTEPLWILCAVLCLYWAREGKWLLSGAAAAAATLTRQQGLFLIAPIVCELWEAHGRDSRAMLKDVRGWTALALAPVSYLGWIAYRSFALSDVRLDLSSVNAFLYSTLLSPSSTKVVAQQSMLPPWDALLQAVQYFEASKFNNTINLTLGLVFVLYTVLAWPRLRLSYRVLAVLIILVSFAYNTGPQMPYMGLPRHLLLAFPVFIGLAPVIEPGKRRHLIAAFSLPVFLLLLFGYVLEAWVP